MRVIIAGSRSFQDYELLKSKMSYYLQNAKDIEIVSGTAYGADKLGERFAKEFNYELKQFPADWDTFGKSAGYKRNVQMADYADALVAFWDGESRGTEHMIRIMKDKNKALRIVKF